MSVRRNKMMLRGKLMVRLRLKPMKIPYKKFCSECDAYFQPEGKYSKMCAKCKAKQKEKRYGEEKNKHKN